MKSLMILAAAACLAASGAAFAQEPVQMTDSEMDKVTAGLGASLDLSIVATVNALGQTVNVAVPVNASVAVDVLGGAVGTATGLPGRV